ncbi:flagellar basal body P-ring formation chaperone FlgA [Stutzerimonas degradans]
MINLKEDEQRNVHMLPHRHGVRGSGGKVVSALLTLCLTGAALAQTATTRTDAPRQIEQAVEGYLRDNLQREAVRQRWQGMQAQVDTSLPASAVRLPACSQPLQVRPSGEAPSPLERQRLEIRCPAGAGWSIDVTSQANVSLPAVHALGIIERGQLIGREDLKLQRINIGKAPRGYFNRLDEVVGKAAKRRIRAGQTLTPALLAQPLAVKRGQPVKIVASHDGIEASTAGEALGDGRTGEVIRVRNVRSGKVIDAQVLDEGVVTSTF